MALFNVTLQQLRNRIPGPPFLLLVLLLTWTLTTTAGSIITTIAPSTKPPPPTQTTVVATAAPKITTIAPSTKPPPPTQTTVVTTAAPKITTIVPSIKPLPPTQTTVVTTAAPRLTTIAPSTKPPSLPLTTVVTTAAPKITTLAPPSERPSTASSKRTTEPVNTVTPVSPTLPPADSANAGCECNYGTIWLDVFLLMEATTSMQFGIDAATDYIVSAFTQLTVGQAEQYQTRLGVIRYASDVELIADLDTYKTTADLYNLEIKTYDDLGTNIEGALQMATNRFMSNVHRIAARPVVIIVGTSFKFGDFNDPLQTAAGFRESGGTIITIEYVQKHGLEVPILRLLASPNYNLTNKKNDGTPLAANDLRDLLCETNCFCRRNWQAYNSDKWNAPQGGCYYPFSISAIQPLAQRTCTRLHNSTLTLVEDSAKNSFLMSIFPSKTKFWLGLTNDGNGWIWQGGYATGYTNWGPDQPGSGLCAYMQQYSGFRFAWFSDDCTDDMCYICQSKPCDSTRYCDTSS